MQGVTGQRKMNRPFPIAAATLLAVLMLAPASSQAAVGVSAAHGFAPRRLVVKFDGESERAQTIALPRRTGVSEAAAALRSNPNVEYAEPDYIATASASEEEPTVPNDPGPLSGPPGAPGGWVSKQWNFLPWEGLGTPLVPVSAGGIDAVSAWEHLEAAGHPGAEGVTVAVLDTGIAYRSLGKRFRRSPDFTAGQFVKGYDFVDGDRLPLDENGHGTHVAGTIAEKTNNGIGLTGLAYRAKLMPVRVLDAQGRGRADRNRQGHPLRRRQWRRRDQHELQLRLRPRSARGRRSAAAGLPPGGRSRSPRSATSAPRPASPRRRPARA